MAKRKKLVLIGAGSAVFTQGMVLDLIRNPGKYKWELALVDIDREVLESIGKLIKKIIDAKEADIELHTFVDRTEALPGADYVITTIGVGGRRAWEQDVFIPRKYGIYQPVGDTAMPGGISRAMRMVPEMINIVRDVERLCPKAKFFNYSNPMSVICRAIKMATSFPVTGLCIGVPGTEWEIADICGLDRSKVSSMAVGVNHLTFIYKIRYDGEDAKPLLSKKVDELYKAEISSDVLDKFYTGDDPEAGFRSIGEPFGWSFFKQHGVFPAPGDRHVTEFLTELFPRGSYYGKILGIDAYSFEGTIKFGDMIHDKMMEAANSPDPLPDDYFKNIHGEHALLMEIIDAIECDSRQMFSANLPNNGAVRNLPYDAVLEMPAVATSEGLRPMMINDFPDVLTPYITKALGIFELTAYAAVHGDRKYMEEAILAGGYISDRNAVSKMVDELLEAQKQYLPQF